MATRSVATVFGGAGFIGRYVVKRLAAAGYVVRVGGRDTEAAQGPEADGPRSARWCRSTSRSPTPATVARAVEGADLVVNLVGILGERRPRRLPAHPGRGRRRDRRARRPRPG